MAPARNQDDDKDIQVLFIDDEEDVRLSGAQTLELEGFGVRALASAEDALEFLSGDWPGVIVTDVKMPKMNGFDLLAHVQEVDPDIPVILITGHGDVAMAIKAIQGGAYDFVEKPAPPEYLIDVVRRARDKRRLVLENRALRDALSGQSGIEGRIIGKSRAIERLREAIANLAGTGVDVLLFGETGTGKELAARCLHDFSDRRGGQFVALNCGAMPESIIESELFGHEAGAFTGAAKKRIGKIEHADGGTVFLDEIESMPLHLQVKLLRVLQERSVERLGGNEVIPVDIRVIAATKVDLARASDEGAFRDDLYYRLNVAKIDLPPLRECRGDIPLLFHHFMDEACRRHDRPPPAVGPEDMRGLTDHAWPGNVRELKNAAERMVLGIDPDGLGAGAAMPEASPALAEQVGDFEKQTIDRALKNHKGNIGETAKALGMPRKKLYLRMRKYNLSRDDYR